MRHSTRWSEGDGEMYLMRKCDKLIVVPCVQYEMAVRLGAEPIREDWIEITDAEARELGFLQKERENI